MPSAAQHQKKQREFESGYYGQLVGAKIVDLRFKKAEYETFGAGSRWPVFTVEKDGERWDVEVSQDEEGNAPGFLFQTKGEKS